MSLSFSRLLTPLRRRPTPSCPTSLPGGCSTLLPTAAPRLCPAPHHLRRSLAPIWPPLARVRVQLRYISSAPEDLLRKAISELNVDELFKKRLRERGIEQFMMAGDAKTKARALKKLSLNRFGWQLTGGLLLLGPAFLFICAVCMDFLLKKRQVVSTSTAAD